MENPHVTFGVPGNHAEVLLEDVEVPSSAMLGGPGKGFEIAQQRLGTRSHPSLDAGGSGSVVAPSTCSASGALSRQAHGGPLADKGVVQGWIADSAAEMQAARLMTLQAAWAIDRRGAMNARREIAMVQFYGARILHDVIDRAIQVHGALGYSADLPLEAMYRYARAARIYDGPDEIHRQSVARSILRDRAAVEGFPASTCRVGAGAPASSSASSRTPAERDPPTDTETEALIAGFLAQETAAGCPSTEGDRRRQRAGRVVDAALAAPGHMLVGPDKNRPGGSYSPERRPAIARGLVGTSASHRDHRETGMVDRLGGRDPRVSLCPDEKDEAAARGEVDGRDLLTAAIEPGMGNAMPRPGAGDVLADLVEPRRVEGGIGDERAARVGVADLQILGPELAALVVGRTTDRLALGIAHRTLGEQLPHRLPAGGRGKIRGQA